MSPGAPGFAWIFPKKGRLESLLGRVSVEAGDSDDIADGVNYGIAPSYAIACTVEGWEGIAIGTAYSVFTISRLVFFTLKRRPCLPFIGPGRASRWIPARGPIFR